MLSIFRKIIPRRARSGTSKYARPTDVFNALIERLTELDDFDKVYFRAKNYKGWAEVRLCKRNLVVSFKFPFNESIETVFEEKRIKAPGHWCSGGFKKRKKAIFRLSINHKDTIGPFLDVIFKKLYGCPNNYTLFGKSFLRFWEIE